VLQLAFLVPGFLIGVAWIMRTSWIFDGERRFTLFDDALISMTYARTLANSGELTWFEGSERVEGITNPLWTAYMALLHLVGITESLVPFAVSITGLLMVLGSALLAGRLARTIIPDEPWIEYASLLAVSLSFPALFWSIRGMEVGVQLLITMGVLLLVVRNFTHEPTGKSHIVILALLVAAGIWTRIDFLVIVLAVAGWLVLSRPSRTAALKLPLVLVSSAFLALIVQTLWRWSYFGEFLPNTYFLKVSGQSLVDRLLRGQWTDGKLPLLIGVLSLSALVFLRYRRQFPVAFHVAGLLISVSGALIAYSTYVGGDAWDQLTIANRYVTPAFSLGAILLVVTTAVIIRTGIHWYFVALPLLACALTAVVGLRAWQRGSIELDANLPAVGTWAVAAFVLLICVIALYWIALARAASPPRAQAPLFVKVITTLAAILLSGSLSWASAAADGGPKVKTDQRYSEYGLVLGSALKPHTSIAVTVAGAPVYFSGLPAIDLLGKSDPVIARMDPVLGFKPGHDKFDYQYSIGTLSPDVIVQLFVADERDFEYVQSLGYVFCELRTSRYENSGLGVWIRDVSSALSSEGTCANISQRSEGYR